MSADGNNSSYRAPSLLNQNTPNSSNTSGNEGREHDSPNSAKSGALQRFQSAAEKALALTGNPAGSSSSSAASDMFKGVVLSAMASSHAIASIDNNSGTVCGVGISINTKSQPYVAVVAEITPKGSADRDGTLKIGDNILLMDGASVENWSINQLKSAMMGHVGTPLKLTVRKDNDRVVDVNLIRGNIEYWEYVDATKRLQEQHREESEHLKSTLLKMKVDMEKLKMENDNLRMEIHQATDRHRWVETSVNLLGKEKQQFEDQVQDLLLQMAELSSNLRTSQAVSRDMTDKARHSEQGRVIEEKLRKTAEARELKAHALLLAEIHRRKEIENSESLLRSRLSEYEARLKANAEIEATATQLQCTIIELESQLRQAVSERDLFKAESLQRREDCKSLASSKTSLEVEVQKLTEMNAQLQHRITELESELTQATEAKKQAINTYQTATQATAAADAARQGAESHVASLKSTVAMLRLEIVGLQSQLESVSASEKRLDLSVSGREKDMLELQSKLELSELRVRNLQSEAEKNMQQLVALEGRVESLLIERDHQAREIGAQSTSWQRTQATLQAKIDGLEARLAEANQELANLKTSIRSMEGKMAATLVSLESEQSNTRIIQSEKDSLLAAKRKLDADASARLQEQTAMQIALQHEKQVANALEKTNADLLARCAELNKQISTVQGQARAVSADSENRLMRIQNLESQLEGLAALRVANLALTSKNQELENLNGALMAENDRALASEKRTRADMQLAIQKVDDLSAEMNRNKFETTVKYANAEKKLMETLAAVTAEKDDLKTELERFYALPNPCGVGIGIEKCASTTPEGGKVQIFKSAELSGAIRVGFELLEIDGIATHTMTLEEVTFKFTRSEEANLTRKEFLVTLKRGSWGPEHCVVSFEDRDMIDEGRWPKPGTLSAAQAGTLKKEDLTRSNKFNSRH